MSENSVSAFEAAYVPSARLAKALRCQPKDAAEILYKRGYRPIQLPQPAKQATVIFRRADLGPLARLPERGTPSGYDAFLIAKVARDGSTYHCQSPVGSGPLVVVNSMRSLWIEVATGGGVIEATVRCDRKRSKRRHRMVAAAARALEAEGFEVVERGDAIDVVARMHGVRRDDEATWAKAGGWLVARLDAIRRAMSKSRAARDFGSRSL